MKRKTIPILTAVLLAAVFSFDACKKADVVTYTVAVIVSAGVSGTPAAGTYYKNAGDQLAYNYTLDEGYTKLTVLLDGTKVAATGTITVSGDHTLQAYSDENSQFTLTVTVATGVSGTPAAGTFTYTQGTLVNYSYALAEGYTGLSVKLDGTDVESSGTVTMSASHTLYANAVKKYNIQGSWALAETYLDGSSFHVTATFSGNYVSGTVIDSAGGSGTYIYDDSTVEFTIIFPDVTYEYSGSFSDDNTMSGTCKRYQTADNVISGTWTATRNTSAAASRHNVLAVNRSKKGDAPQDKTK